MQKKSKQLMRVFFIIAFISLIGFFWQFNKKNTTKVKIVGGSFAEGIIGTPRFINPVLAQSPSDKDMTKLIFSSLLEQDKQGNIQYHLADDIEISPDKKTYTLKLKENIYFQDGEPITTEDLIFTIEKIQDPLIRSPLFPLWEGIKMKKINEREIQFILPQAYSDFIYNFKIGILPKHLWNNIKKDEFILNILNKNPIGSGSYQVEKIEYKKDGPAKSYTLKKNIKSKAYIKKIKIIFYANEKELAEAYRQGKIESTYGLSANRENRDLFENKNSFTGKLPRIFGLFFNQNKSKDLKNILIRKIINESINRNKIINNVFSNYAYPTDNPFGELFSLKENKKKTLEEDLKKIESNSWEKNNKGIYINKKTKEKLSFEISTVNSQELIDIANIIKEELARQGIEITVRIFKNGDFHEKVIRPRDYEILLFGYMLEKPTDLYAFWHSSQKSDPGLNISLYTNSKVDKELEKLRKDQKTANLDIISNEIKKDIPAVFIYSPAYTYLLPKKIKGENIYIKDKQDRFSQIEEWYINTRKIWNFFIKKD